MDTWRGRQIHSHVYRVPEPFQNEVTKTVFLFSKILGSSLSGQDIAVELAGVAKQIYLISKSLDVSEGLYKIISKHLYPQASFIPT